MTDAKCPFCKRRLVPGGLRSFESLIDHAFDPNREEYPLRPVYICGCLPSKDCFWDDYGGYYCRDYASYTGLKKCFGDPKDEYRGLHAINSHAWRFVRERNRERWLNTFAIYRWWQKWRWNRLARSRELEADNRG